MLEVIDQAISLCKINNCHVHVAYIPLNNRKNPSKPQNADRVQTEFGAQMYQRLDKASQLKSYINLANNLDFLSEYSAMYSPAKAHLSPKGYHFLASMIAENF